MASVQCESCGMKMKRPEDFGGKDEHNTYCNFCCNKTGKLNTYDKVLNDMITFVMKDTNYDKQKAREISLLHLKNQPAWRDK